MRVQRGDIELLPRRKKRKASNMSGSSTTARRLDASQSDCSSASFDETSESGGDDDNHHAGIHSLPIDCMLCEDFVYDKRVLVACPAEVGKNNNANTNHDRIEKCMAFAHIYCLADLFLRLDAVRICCFKIQLYNFLLF